MSAVNGKKSIKRQEEESDVQNTEAQLEAAALMDVQSCPAHRCTNRAWNNKLLEREQSAQASVRRAQ